MVKVADYLTQLDAPPADLTAFAARAYAQVFRDSLDAPGFALISFAAPITSTELRGVMVALKGALASLHPRPLEYQSMGRFNQQATTKFHLDAAPDESYLMLGYEPTEVESQLRIADYSRAAAEWGITPKQLLAERNPMFAGHEAALSPYVVEVAAFDRRRSQVVLLNNSRLESGSLGVLHQALVPVPIVGRDRVVNSTMIAVAAAGVDARRRAEFLASDGVAGGVG